MITPENMILGIVASVFASGGFWTFLQYIIGQREKKKAGYLENATDFKNGLCALLRNEIVVAHRLYTQIGYCTLEDKRNISEMYAAYHALGGNGSVTSLYEMFNKLPILIDNHRKKDSHADSRQVDKAG